MKVVADTSALVSLAYGSVLELFLKEFEVAVPAAVIEELEEMSQGSDPASRRADEVLAKEDSLTVYKVGSERFVTSRVDRGESSCVELTRKIGADFLITDDFRALPEIEILVTKADVAISPIVLKAFVDRGLLDRGEAVKKLERMGKEGGWLERPIYERAKKLLDAN